MLANGSDPVRAGVAAMVSKSPRFGGLWVAVVCGVLALTPIRAEGQTGIAPRPSMLFRPVTPGASPAAVVVDSVDSKKRVQAAVTWGVIGALVGFIISSDADGSAIPRAPAVIGLTVAGVLGGLLTGGKSGN